MTPEDAIYRKVFGVCQTIENTFDYLPESEDHYPFIFVGESTNDNESNSDLMGNVTIRLDVYGTLTQRNELDRIKSGMHNAFIHIKSAFGYHVRMTDIEMNTRIDQHIRAPELRRVLVLITFDYTKKGSI